MPLLSIVYAAGFDSVSNVPQEMTAWHAWLVGTKQVQKNYWRNGQMNDVVKELAGQNTLNERPILCNFFLNNNLPLWSQWTPRKVKSPAYIYFAAPIFRNPPSMMSQRHFSQVSDSTCGQVFVYSNAVTIIVMISLWYLLIAAVFSSLPNVQGWNRL